MHAYNSYSNCTCVAHYYEVIVNLFELSHEHYIIKCIYDLKTDFAYLSGDVV